MPTEDADPTAGTPPPDLDTVLADAGVRARAERSDREDALYRALRVTVGDDRLDACDIIDLAEYIRSGARGVPLPECAAPPMYMSAPASVHTIRPRP